MEVGKLLVVCPVNDETDVCGIGIFSTDLVETKRYVMKTLESRQVSLDMKFIQVKAFPEVTCRDK